MPREFKIDHAIMVRLPKNTNTKKRRKEVPEQFGNIAMDSF
ncbi:1416_t:CDS:1, partial [Diversispora eburnea]